ncbi:hypothetical protein HYS00_00225 [Candidatus Microgenomates bacterium]|nr:hypothetical protein [Candidatus Microgenomates bacterium]
MCGIAGFAGLRDDKLLKQFSQQLKHRGPDGEGFYRDQRVSLLSRRLAIIDVKGGNQPIYNESKSAVVVYNGEIYNYRELPLKSSYTDTTNGATNALTDSTACSESHSTISKRSGS